MLYSSSSSGGRGGGEATNLLTFLNGWDMNGVEGKEEKGRYAHQKAEGVQGITKKDHPHRRRRHISICLFDGAASKDVPCITHRLQTMAAAAVYVVVD